MIYLTTAMWEDRVSYIVILTMYNLYITWVKRYNVPSRNMVLHRRLGQQDTTKYADNTRPHKVHM